MQRPPPPPPPGPPKNRPLPPRKPPRPPPPPPGGFKRKPPPPPPSARSNGRSPPPPPPPRMVSTDNKRSQAAISVSSPSNSNNSTPPRKKARTNRRGSLSIAAPVVMRDVDAFEKKFQVGEGTYGSVFVARDRSSNGIVALKRINTEQEENGFPITALREVKLLKGLKHPNMVLLKEIVCSKGTYHAFATNKIMRLEALPIVRIASLL